MKHLLLVALTTIIFSLCAKISFAQDGGANYSKKDIEYIRSLYSNFEHFMYKMQIPDRKTFLPVKAHIIRKTNGSGGLRERDLYRALDQLNEHFSRTSLQFELCGSEYIDDTRYYQISKGSEMEAQLRSKHYAADAINLYFADEVLDGRDAVRGYSYMPNEEYDAIVFDYHHLNDGSSLAHEMGHFFCLLDTYSNFNGEEMENGANCDIAGDLICDTPADRYREAVSRGPCGGNFDRSGNRTSLPYPTADNIMSNYLPGCRVNFTAQQIQVMYATFLTERKYLYCHGETPERCETAIEMECGKVYEGTTTGGDNNFSKQDYDCYLYGNDYKGNDRMYKFYLPTNTDVTIKLNGLNTNLDLFVLKSCEEDAGCIASSFNSGRQEEKITLNNAMGTFYVVVDGDRRNVNGKFKLTVECHEMGITSCDEVIPVECGQTISGHTVNGYNFFNAANYHCYYGGSDYNGREKVYRVELHRKSTLKVGLKNINADLDLFILKSCDVDANCIASSISHGLKSESVELEHAEGTYYIVVDGYQMEEAGNFKLSVSCDREAGQPNLVCREKGYLDVNDHHLAISDFWVQNKGNGKAGKSYIGYYLSKDENISTDDYFIGKDMVAPLAPNEKSKESFYAKLTHLNVPEGVYYLGAVLDYRDEVAETSERDNNDCYWSWPKIRIRRDDPCDYTKVLECGDKIWGDTRDGENNYMSSHYDCYDGYNSYDGKEKIFKIYVPVGADLRVKMTRLSDDLDLFVRQGCGYESACLISSRNEHLADEEVVVENAGGYYHIIVDGYEEGREGKFMLTVNCEKKDPNLVCKERGKLKIDGYKLTISDVWLGNDGETRAEENYLGYYLSKDKNITRDDYLIGRSEVKALEPGETTSAEIHMNLANKDIPYGHYYVGLLLDYKNNVHESDENDNNDCYWSNPRFELPRPNPCDYVKEISCGDWISGDTRDGVNHFETEHYSCYSGEYGYYGNDVIYKIKVAPDTKLKVRLSDLRVNQDLFIMEKCGYENKCIAKSTSSGTSAESITLDNASGTYYIVVDGCKKDENGKFKLQVTCETPKPNLVCKERGQLRIDGYKLWIKNVWIQNNGYSKAGASHVGYYISKDKNITKDDYYLGEDYVSALEPGETSGEDFYVNLYDKDLPYGWYYVGMILDHKNKVAETNEGDNNDCYWSSPKFEIPRPDPCDYVKEVSCGDWIWGDTRDGVNHFETEHYSCYDGEYGYYGNDVIYKIKVAPYTKLKVKISDLQVNQDLFLMEKCGYENKCVAKSTKSGTSAETITLENASGTYYIVVDGCKKDENGKFKLQVTCEAPKPNLVCKERGQLRIDGYKLWIKNVWIENKGYGKAGASHVGYYLSKDKNITKDDYFIGEDYVGELKHGETSGEDFYVDLYDKHLPYGWYYVGMILDHKNKVKEANEGDNNDCYWTSPKFESPRPNPCDYVKEVSCGDWIWGDTRDGVNHFETEHYSCYNGDYGYYGNDVVYKIKVAPYTKLKVKISDLQVNQDLFIMEKCGYDNKCIAKSTKSGKSDETITLENASGTYYIVVDGCKKDENGRFKMQVTCEAPKPNLVCKERGQLRIDGYKLWIKNVWIENQGYGKAGASHVGYYLSKDKNITKDDYFIGEDYVGELKHGETSGEDFYVDLYHADLPYGWYYVGMILDHKNKVKETNEGDNNDCYWTSPKFELPRPNPCDYVKEVSCGDWIWGDTRDGVNHFETEHYSCYNGDYGYYGNDVIYKVKVAPYTKLKVKISDLKVNQDLFIMEKCGYENKCIAKSTNSGKSDETITLENASGTYYIVVDGCKKDENGRFKLQVTCEAPKPNLVCKERGQLRIDGYKLWIKNVWIENQGYGKAGASHVGYYLSKDKNITKDDYFIGEDYVGELKHGETSGEDFHVDLYHTDLPYGWYYVGMILDHKNKVYETNEGDNNDCYWTSPKFELPKPDPCDYVKEVSCGDWIWGDTRNDRAGVNHFESADYNCYDGPYGYYGNDVIYKIKVAPYTKLTVKISDLQVNQDLFIMEKCGYQNKCIAMSNKGGTSSESITLENASGTYYIVVDGCKKDENGKFKLQVTCEAPKPNLVCKERGQLRIDGYKLWIKNVWLQNAGYGKAGASHVGYYLSKDKNITTDDYFIGEDYVSELKHNETSGEDFHVDLSYSEIPYGWYYVGMVLDYKDKVRETNEGDNNDCYWTSPKFELPRPNPCDYVREIGCGDWVNGDTRGGVNHFESGDYKCYSGQYGYYGNDVIYKFRVPGYTKAKISLTNLHVNQDLFILDKCSYGASCIAKGIKGGTSDEVVTVENHGSGYKTYYIVVDGCKKDENGKFEIGVECEAPKPNLVCKERGSLRVDGYKLWIKNVWIQNSGYGKAGASHVGYYLSKDKNITTDDYFIGEDYVSELKYGETSGEDFHVDLGYSDIPYGWYYVGMILDHKNKVKETDEGDNNDCYWSSPKFELPRPNPCDYVRDISCGDWVNGDTRGGVNHFESSDYKCYSGQYGYYGNDVIYRLKVPAHTRAKITLSNLWVNQDLYVLDKCSYGASCIAKSIKGGTQSETVTLEAASSAKTYYLVVDGCKKDENGKFEIGIECEKPQPNLVCKERGSLVVEDKKITIVNTWIQNMGPGDASATKVGYYLSKDKNITKSDYWIGEEPISALKAGKTTGASFTVDLAYTDVPYGQYYVGTIIDYQDKVYETNESDNDCYWSSPRLTFEEPKPCDYVTNISCGADIDDTNRHARNLYNDRDYKCYSGSYDYEGNERVYKVNVSGTKDLKIKLSYLTARFDVFVLSKCSYGATCIAKSTRSGLNEENITIEDANGVYYIVVDAYRAGEKGDYKLSVDCVSPPAPVVACECNSIYEDQICDNFESYDGGAYVCPQANCWTTMSGDHGGAEDAYVRLFQGNKVLEMRGQSNKQQQVMLELGNRRNGKYELKFKLKANNGEKAHYGVLHSSADGPNAIADSYVQEVFFDGDGKGEVMVDGRAHSFSYSRGEWVEVFQQIDVRSNVSTLYIEGNRVHRWNTEFIQDYSVQGHSLKALYFSPMDKSYQFMVDEVEMEKVSTFSDPYPQDQSVVAGAQEEENSLRGESLLGESAEPLFEVAEESAITEFSYYPNPTTGVVYLSGKLAEADHVKVRILNAVGQVVATFEQDHVDVFRHEADLSAFARGVYLIQVQTSTETRTEQVLLMK